jgi:hypothetical protein
MSRRGRAEEDRSYRRLSKRMDFKRRRIKNS